jgi:hypothetical protein
VWHHHSSDERERSQYITDSWTKDTFLAMGHVAAHNRFVHLYLNGIYWGVYNPSERMDKDFAASYLGGNASDFDVIKDYTEAVDGTVDAWNEMMNMANRGLTSNAVYQRIQGNNPDGTRNPSYDRLVDVENIIDYMILNFYAGNTDWDHHNWAAARSRIFSSQGFQFLPWDTEHIFEDLHHNMLNENNPDCPSALFQKLRENADFRRLFADRVQLFCFNGGLLTPGAVLESWRKRASEIEMAIIAESARWGDYRRDVHQYQPQGPFDLYTKNKHWQAEQDFLQNEYFPNRTTVFISQLRQANLFPTVSAPEFLINGIATYQHIISAGDVLSMTAPVGNIYYTTDGTDPFLSNQSQSADQKVLFAEDADKRVLVPKSDIGNDWRSDVNFDDSAWQLCSGAPGGVGYEKSSGYENWITLDVANDMYNDGSTKELSV